MIRGSEKPNLWQLQEPLSAPPSLSLSPESPGLCHDDGTVAGPMPPEWFGIHGNSAHQPRSRLLPGGKELQPQPLAQHLTPRGASMGASGANLG